MKQIISFLTLSILTLALTFTIYIPEQASQGIDSANYHQDVMELQEGEAGTIPPPGGGGTTV